MRRWLGLALLLLLLWCAGGVPVRGAAVVADGQQKALATVQRFFSLPEVVQVTPANAGGRHIWRITGRTNEPLAEVDTQTGRLLWVDLTAAGRRLQSGPLGEAYPRADALAQAWALVQENRPEWAGTLRLAPDWLDWQPDGWDYATYRFTWIPYVNDLPVLGTQLTVAVDRQTGALLSLRGGYPVTGAYPPVQDGLNAAEALERYRQAVQPQLVYVAADPVLNPSQMRLVYRFDAAGLPLDPQTGRLLPGPPMLQQALVAAAEPEPDRPLVPLPVGTAAPLSPPPLPLTADRAMYYAGQVLGLSPDDATVGVSDQQGAIQLSFNALPYDGEVELDPATGLLRSAWRSVSSPTATPGAAGEAEARRVAVAAIQRYYAPLVDQLGLPAAVEPDGLRDVGYSFFFPRHYQGIPVTGDGIRVTVSPAMTWTSILAQWRQDLILPDPAAAISEAAAAERFFAGRTAVLLYQPALTLRQLCLTTEAPDPVPMQAVYYLTGPDGATAIDAFTGQPIGLVTPPAALTARFAGHWAESELLLLATTGLLGPVDPEPSAPLTSAQAERLLAAYEGWPPVIGDRPLHPDQAVTRAEFATMVARRIGLELSAPPAFTDLAGLTPEAQNAANALAALGLLKSGGSFRGDAPLTQAEGATLFTRLLQRRYPDGLPWRLPAPFRFKPWTEPITCP